MVAKTVMVYSRQVIMIGHLILKMQSMLMLTEANGMFSVEMDYQRTKAVLGSDVVQSAVRTARQREQAIEEQRYAVRRKHDRGAR